MWTSISQSFPNLVKHILPWTSKLFYNFGMNQVDVIKKLVFSELESTCKFYKDILLRSVILAWQIKYCELQQYFGFLDSKFIDFILIFSHVIGMCMFK
jgi:hypothetical protein